MIGQKLTNRLTIPVTGISILINIVGPLALNLETANRNPLIKEKNHHQRAPVCCFYQVLMVFYLFWVVLYTCLFYTKEVHIDSSPERQLFRSFHLVGSWPHATRPRGAAL